MTRTRTATFESSPWSSDLTPEVPVSRIRLEINAEHVSAATWSRYEDPVSLALRTHLSPHACACVFWNSDGFAPRYSDDEARIGIHLEVQDPETGQFDRELHYWLPLPQRAAQAMWKLRYQGAQYFTPFRTTLHLPKNALESSCPPLQVSAQPKDTGAA